MINAAELGLDLVAGLLAQDGPRQTGPDFGKASPFGLIVVLLLLIATFVLVWSMNRHLRRLPKSFGGGDVGQGMTVDSTTDPAAGSGTDPAAGSGAANGAPGEGPNRDSG